MSFLCENTNGWHTKFSFSDAVTSKDVYKTLLNLELGSPGKAKELEWLNQFCKGRIKLEISHYAILRLTK